MGGGGLSGIGNCVEQIQSFFRDWARTDNKFLRHLGGLDESDVLGT